VFEIGNSLREARLRRSVDFAQAEAATKIRGKYLRALEDEQFELLPSQTYVKGFLRTYAEFLGLDGQLYVDEYNSRFVSGGDEHEPRVRRSAARPQRRNRRIETNVVLLALAAIAVLMVIVIAAWNAGDSPSKTRTTPRVTTSAAKPNVAVSLLSLRAVRGPSRVTARVNNGSGAIVYDGTVQKGAEPLHLDGKKLWVYVSSPENLRIVVAGHTVVVHGLRPRVAVVTKTGWHLRS
jgi:cytoskeleton protein RodZ